MQGHQIVTDAWREEIERRLADGESLRAISRDKGVCYQTIQYWRDKWGLPKLKPVQSTGADHANWRGGISVDRQGYRLVYAPERVKAHPYTYEHILVAERMMGRRLHRNEHVHHLNGQKLDNRPENLLVCTQSEHHKLHRKLEQLAMEMVRSGQIVFRGGTYDWA